jgi:hypothetical protein
VSCGYKLCKILSESDDQRTDGRRRIAIEGERKRRILLRGTQNLLLNFRPNRGNGCNRRVCSGEFARDPIALNSVPLVRMTSAGFTS